MSFPFSLSVKAIVRNHAGECLIIRRSGYSKHNAGKWDFPGGKVDRGENFDTALIREIQEETTLRIHLVGVAGCAQSQTPDRVVVYLFMETQAETSDVALSDEHTEYRWVPVAELPTLDMCEQFKNFCQNFAANHQ